MLVAWVAIRAAEQSGQGGAVEVARWMRIPVPTPGGQRDDLDAARDALLVTAIIAVSLAVVVLAAPALAAGLTGAAVTKLFLAGGAAALFSTKL
jgi:hypothetical protein